MTEFAVIDIGSNSIRYAEERGGALPEKEIYTTRLGSGLAETGLLAKETMSRSLEVIERLASRAGAAGLKPAAYATSAVRDAENGREFAALVEERTGVPVEILEGSEEARLAFSGAVGNGSGYDTLLDIGGASMQVVRTDYAASFPAGCVRCGDVARGALRLPDCDTLWSTQQMVVDGYVDGVMDLPKLEVKALVGIGGTITTLAALEAGLAVFDRSAVETVTLTRSGVRRLISRLAEMGAKRAEHPLLRERHDVILYGAYILHHAMERLKADSMGVSCADGMEGYLRLLKTREADDE